MTRSPTRGVFIPPYRLATAPPHYRTHSHRTYFDLQHLQPPHSSKIEVRDRGSGLVMDKEKARDFLTSLLNKNLRVGTTDGRMFLGQFKCTDPDRNVVLGHAYEYRQPSLQQRAEAAENTTSGSGTLTMDMTSRYLGLVVVPGKYIVKMEVEEFASQIKDSKVYESIA